MSDPTPRTLAEWLRDAYEDPAAGCPPPEAFLAEELADLPPDARQRLEAHADTCPSCSAERELARAFDPVATSAAEGADIEWLTARLGGEQRAAETPPLARVVTFPDRRVLPAWTRLAAAAMLVLAAGLVFRLVYSPAPPLPPPPQSGSLRGGEVELVAPIGEVAEVPKELSWNAAPGAHGYRVWLATADETPLWGTRVSTTAAALPPQVTGNLHRAVGYLWSVEAIAADGRVIARSPAARFRVRPVPEP